MHRQPAGIPSGRRRVSICPLPRTEPAWRDDGWEPLLSVDTHHSIGRVLRCQCGADGCGLWTAGSSGKARRAERLCWAGTVSVQAVLGASGTPTDRLLMGAPQPATAKGSSLTRCARNEGSNQNVRCRHSRCREVENCGAPNWNCNGNCRCGHDLGDRRGSSFRRHPAGRGGWSCRWRCGPGSRLRW
jgi:hypothetical protein